MKHWSTIKYPMKPNRMSCLNVREFRGCSIGGYSGSPQIPCASGNSLKPTIFICLFLKGIVYLLSVM